MPGPGPAYKHRPQLDAAPVTKDAPKERTPLGDALLKGSTYAAGEAARSPANQPSYDEQVASRAPEKLSDDELDRQYYAATGRSYSGHPLEAPTDEQVFDIGRDQPLLTRTELSDHLRSGLARKTEKWTKADVETLATLYVTGTSRYGHLIDCPSDDVCAYHDRTKKPPDAMAVVADGFAESGPAIRGVAKGVGIGTTVLLAGATAAGAAKGAALGDTVVGAANTAMRTAAHVGGEFMDESHPHPRYEEVRAEREEARRNEALKRENVAKFVHEQRPNAQPDLVDAVHLRVQQMR